MIPLRKVLPCTEGIITPKCYKSLAPPKHFPLIHHIQPVITITDRPLAVPENEIRLAQPEVCPSPETDSMQSRSPSFALFENLSDT
jgi:hypothetical protein